MLHEGEVLTDNTKIKYCRQCKKCRYWGNHDDPFSNKYDKTNCDIYPMPGMKPSEVINNTGSCQYFKDRG